MKKFLRSIRFRLFCLVALFLIPQIFQTSIILRRAQTDISFARKELVGTAYLRDIWPLKSAVDTAAARLLPLGVIEPLMAKFAAAQAAYDGELETAVESAAVMKALRSVESMRDYPAVNEHLLTLITKVGDKSNLILDPDLDTYYLMNLAVERLPELSREGSRSNLAVEIIRKEGRTVEAVDDLKFAETSFANAIERVASSIRLSLSGTEDATLATKVTKTYSELADFNKSLSGIFKQAGSRMETGKNIDAELYGKAVSLRTSFRDKLNETYVLTVSELDRLLLARISRFEDARNRDLAMVGISVLLALGVATFMTLTIMSNLFRLRKSLDKLANGDFTAKIAALDRKDELGGLARSVERLRSTITQKLQEDFYAEKAGIVRDEQKRAIAGMAGELDAAITGSVLTIDSLGAELSQTVGFVSNSTAATRAAINTSVLALDESVANVRAATNSLSELAMSVAEISGQASRAADATRIARSRALEAKTRSSELDKTVSEIQASAKLVESIAAQTNLLALNATIEAARAGEAGRGFAVVAQEVKMLAAQSAKTTSEIQARIIAVSQVSHSVTRAIDEMGETIDRMDEVSLSIAAAVEQHNVTTAEITQRVQHTADSADRVAHQITDVSAMADSTDEVASSLTGLASKLADEANSLRRESTSFMSRLVA